MTISVLSPKYQIVIPKKIRKSMNLQPGQRLQLAQKDGSIEIRPVLTPEQLIGFLADCSNIPFEREKRDREL
jgi:AbrB family looped-hinge helix DNA binding protein